MHDRIPSLKWKRNICKSKRSSAKNFFPQTIYDSRHTAFRESNPMSSFYNLFFYVLLFCLKKRVMKSQKGQPGERTIRCWFRHYWDPGVKDWVASLLLMKVEMLNEGWKETEMERDKYVWIEMVWVWIFSFQTAPNGEQPWRVQLWQDEITM